MSSKVWDEITCPFPNFSGCTVEVWEWISTFISHLITHVMWCPCWDQSKISVERCWISKLKTKDRQFDNFVVTDGTVTFCATVTTNLSNQRPLIFSEGDSSNRRLSNWATSYVKLSHRFIVNCHPIYDEETMHFWCENSAHSAIGGQFFVI